MDFGQEPETAPLISLTPLIDVDFILLVFFMLASSFLDWRAVDLRIASSSGKASGEVKSLTIRLPQDGVIEISGQRVSMDDMAQRVAARLSEQPNTRILIAPDGGVALQTAVRVLEKLKQVGADNVSLIGKRSN